MYTARVNVVSALETDMFFVELVGPTPSQQTQANPGSTPTVSGTIFTKSDGVFGASFTATIAGVYKMTIQIAQAEILGSPYSVTVLASSAVAAASRIISDPIVRGRVNIPTHVTIQAYDRFGNRLGTAADDFLGNFPEDDGAVLLSSPTTNPIGSGRYNVTFMVTKTGKYQAIITLNSAQVSGSPVILDIVSGYTTALQSIVNNSDIALTARAGTLFAFKIHANDLFSNHRHEGGDLFDVVLLSPVFSECAVCSSCTAGIPQVSISNVHCSGATNGGVCDSCPSYRAETIDLGGADSSQCQGYESSTVRDLSAAQCYPGTYLGIMVFTKSGNYGVRVRLAGIELVPDPVLLTVYPSTPVGKNSQVQEALVGGKGLPLSTATAGISHSFMIKSHDLYMNPVETIEEGNGFRMSPILLGHSIGNPGFNVSVGSWDAVIEGSGLLRVSFILTISAMYRCQIYVLELEQLTGNEISGSDFYLKAKPGKIDASKSVAVGNGLSIGTAGSISSFIVNSRDVYANFKTEGSGGSWTAILSFSSRAPHDTASTTAESINGTGIDQHDGSFRITYALTRAGVYSLAVTSSTSADTLLAGTPSLVRIFPGRAAIASTVAQGAGLAVGSVDAVASFLIHSFDQFGNARTQGLESFAVVAEGGWAQALDSSVRSTTRINGIVQDLNNGSYAVSYFVTHSGDYSLHVTLDSAPISGSPFGAYVHSGATLISNCEPMTAIPINLPAGDNALQVLAKDRYGNPRTVTSSDASRFVVDLRPSKAIEDSNTTGSAHDGSPGIYEMSYQVTTSGNYELYIVYTIPAFSDPCMSDDSWRDSSGRACDTYTNHLDAIHSASASDISTNSSATGVCGHEASNSECKICVFLCVLLHIIRLCV